VRFFLHIYGCFSFFVCALVGIHALAICPLVGICIFAICGTCGELCRERLRRCARSGMSRPKHVELGRQLHRFGLRSLGRQQRRHARRRGGARSRVSRS
jgi:hypothetical protein